MTAALLLAFVTLLTGTATTVNVTAEEEHVRYIIIGAGPGGLQLAHYLDSAGRDYTVLEKNGIAGSFFTSLPRFRKLISINKRHSGREELDHVMRHDWNSLLSDPSHSAGEFVSSTDPTWSIETAKAAGWLLFRNFSREYYPHADDLVRYLGDWAAGSASRDLRGRHPAAPLRIQYNVSVLEISPLPLAKDGSKGGPLPPRFRLQLSDGRVMSCTFLVMATGLPVRSANGAHSCKSVGGSPTPCPLQEPVLHRGLNTAEAMARGWLRAYHNASVDLGDYEGARVLILGRGNAAFEVANAVLEVAASVTLVGQASRRLRLAYETHYPVSPERGCVEGLRVVPSLLVHALCCLLRETSARCTRTCWSRTC